MEYNLRVYLPLGVEGLLFACVLKFAPLEQIQQPIQYEMIQGDAKSKRWAKCFNRRALGETRKLSERLLNIHTHTHKHMHINVMPSMKKVQLFPLHLITTELRLNYICRIPATNRTRGNETNFLPPWNGNGKNRKMFLRCEKDTNWSLFACAIHPSSVATLPHPKC